MIKHENILTADPGKFLKHKEFDGLRNTFVLGTSHYNVNGEIKLVNVTESDIIEVYIVIIDDVNYVVEGNNYGELVTNLIRQKYSLDDELALIANLRLNKNLDKEQEFQDWREKCKNAAKQIFNE